MAAKTLFNPNSSETLFSSSQRIGSQHDSSQQKPPVDGFFLELCRLLIILY